MCFRYTAIPSFTIGIHSNLGRPAKEAVDYFTDERPGPLAGGEEIPISYVWLIRERKGTARYTLKPVFGEGMEVGAERGSWMSILAQTVEEATTDVEFQRELLSDELEVLTTRMRLLGSQGEQVKALRHRALDVARALECL